MKHSLIISCLCLVSTAALAQQAGVAYLTDSDTLSIGMLPPAEPEVVSDEPAAEAALEVVDSAATEVAATEVAATEVVEPVAAPAPLTVAQQINAIKMDFDTYLFAESTSATKEEAFDNAKFLLQIEVENYLKSIGQFDSLSQYVMKAENGVDELQTMRGNRFRAFVFVKKSDIIAITSSQEIISLYPTPAHETKAPKANTPTAPAPTAPAPAAPQPEQPAQQVKETPAIQLSPIEQEMLTVVRGEDIQTFVKRLKSEGKIAAFGKYSDMPYSIDCLIFVYNRDRAVVAHLRKTGSEMLNLSTMQPDNITNYKGCGAIWFQLK